MRAVASGGAVLKGVLVGELWPAGGAVCVRAVADGNAGSRGWPAYGVVFVRAVASGGAGSRVWPACGAVCGRELWPVAARGLVGGRRAALSV